jgi:hypothetical protein
MARSIEDVVSPPIIIIIISRQLSSIAEDPCPCQPWLSIIIIPPGCTGVTQPVDVGYNKPFKNHVRDKYEKWMIEESADLAKPPTRKNVAQWIVASEMDMTPLILRNAWKRHGLSYFPSERKEHDENGNEDSEEDDEDLRINYY